MYHQSLSVHNKQCLGDYGCVPSMVTVSLCFAFHSPGGTTISAIVVSDISGRFAFLACYLSMSYLFVSIDAVR